MAAWSHSARDLHVVSVPRWAVSRCSVLVPSPDLASVARAAVQALETMRLPEK